MSKDEIQPASKEEVLYRAHQERYIGLEQAGEIKVFIEGWRTRFAKLQNWILIIFLLGILTGGTISYYVFQAELNKATRIGGMIINDLPYNVTKRLL